MRLQCLGIKGHFWRGWRMVDGWYVCVCLDCDEMVLHRLDGRGQ